MYTATIKGRRSKGAQGDPREARGGPRLAESGCPRPAERRLLKIIRDLVFKDDDSITAEAFTNLFDA